MDQDDAFEELRKTVSHKMQRLQEKNRMLRDELRQERKRHQKTEEELSQQREKRILECKICYMQPDRWVFILCGHMVCRSCAGSLGTTEKCPICRAPITGYIGCYPFAG
jgi:rubrerythrin